MQNPLEGNVWEPQCANAVMQGTSVKTCSRHTRNRDPCKGGCKCKMIKETPGSALGRETLQKNKNKKERAWGGEDLEGEFCSRIWMLTPKVELSRASFVATAFFLAIGLENYRIIEHPGLEGIPKQH